MIMETLVHLALFLLLAADPTFDESFRAGLLALQRNDLSAAAENLGTAARLAPNNGRVWVALARTYWKLHQNAKAGDAATRAPTPTAPINSSAASSARSPPGSPK